MNDIAKRQSTELSLDMADRLLAGIEDSQATTMIAGGGKDLIKLQKSDGSWAIGQSDEPMQVGSNWCINILSICHGFVCWSDNKGTRKNERLGEIMVPMSEPKPKKPDPIDGFPFNEQRSFEALCLNGEDEGNEVQFKNGSLGTMKAFNALVEEIKAQLRTNRAYPNPVIQFKSDKYKHPQYNWIHTPIFEVIGWANMAGEMEHVAGADPELEAAPKANGKPAARVKPPLTPPQPDVETVPPTAARTTQRRRPVA